MQRTRFPPSMSSTVIFWAGLSQEYELSTVHVLFGMSIALLTHRSGDFESYPEKNPRMNAKVRTRSPTRMTIAGGGVLSFTWPPRPPERSKPRW